MFGKLTLLSLVFSISVASANDFFSSDFFKKSNAKLNRDGSITYHWPVAHNGTEYFPIRYDTDRDLDSACRLFGFDFSLPYPGLNLVKASDQFKLMFNKYGSLNDYPVSDGFAIKKLTCYRKQNLKTSILFNLRTNSDGSVNLSDIRILLGDLKFRIAPASLENESRDEDRICRFLGKSMSISSERSAIVYRNRRGVYARVGQHLKVVEVVEAPSFMKSITCSKE